MKVIIKTRKLQLTEPLRAFTERKFYGLKKFINILKREDEIGKTMAEVMVELEKESRHHKKGEVFVVRCRVSLPGRSLIVKARSDDMAKAIVKAKDEMKIEIEKYKLIKTEQRRRKQRKLKRQIII